MKYPPGTQYRSGTGRLCTVRDLHVTRSALTGEVVRVRYACTHDLMGQQITDTDVVETTIARGIERLKGQPA